MTTHDFAALTSNAHEDWTLFAARLHAIGGPRADWDIFYGSQALPRPVTF